MTLADLQDEWTKMDELKRRVLEETDALIPDTDWPALRTRFGYLNPSEFIDDIVKLIRAQELSISGLLKRVEELERKMDEIDES